MYTRERTEEKNLSQIFFTTVILMTLIVALYLLYQRVTTEHNQGSMVVIETSEAGNNEFTQESKPVTIPTQAASFEPTIQQLDVLSMGQFGGLNLTFEPSINMLKAETVTVLLPYSPPLVQSDEISLKWGSFIAAFIAGNQPGMTDLGTWFLRNLQNVDVEAARIELVLAIEGTSRFPDNPYLIHTSERSSQNPGIKIKYIPQLANAIVALRALGADDIADTLKSDALAALELEAQIIEQERQVQLALQAQASADAEQEQNQAFEAPESVESLQAAQVTEPVDVPVESTASQTESGIVDGSTSDTQEVIELPRNLNIPPGDVDSSSLGFSPYGILMGVWALRDFFEGNPGITYWEVTNMEYLSPRGASTGVADFLGLSEVKLWYVTMVGHRPDGSVTIPVKAGLFWLGGLSPFEIGDQLEVKSILGWP